MRKPETDPDNVRMSDVLCDFCLCEWTEEIAMVEGHHGSCICGSCLRSGWEHVVVSGLDDAIEGWKCTMCLENRSDPCFKSPMREEARVCRRCIRLSAQALRKDDTDWDAPGPVRS